MLPTVPAPRRQGRRSVGVAVALTVAVAPLLVLNASAAEPRDDRLVGESQTEPRPMVPTSDALGGVLGGDLAAAQEAAVGDPTYPGLPALQGYQWDGAGSTGITEITASRQVVRFPPLALAADVGVKVVPPPPGYTSNILSTLGGFILSPTGADHRYGDSPVLGVRTLAFGALPVEAEVHIQQLRDENDLPIAIAGSQTNPFDRPTGTTRYDDALLGGKVDIRVSDLTVDGVRVEVGPDCHTGTPATLSLVGRGYFRRGAVYWQLPVPNPTPETTLTLEQVRRDYYVQAQGGLLTGTLDVPTFTGCRGDSGDLSRIVSVAVSGVGQPVKVRQSTTFTCFPTDKVRDCKIPDEFPYPDPPAEEPQGQVQGEPESRGD